MKLFDIDYDDSQLAAALDPSQWVRSQQKMVAAVEREMQATVERVKASTEFKDRTGLMRNTVTYEISVAGQDMIVRLYAPAPYSGYLEDGTAAHEIVPNKKKILRWTSNGNTYWAKKVSHPGTRARHILANAINLEKIAAAAGGAFVQQLKR